MTERQLDLVDDTALRIDPRFARSQPISVRQPCGKPVTDNRSSTVHPEIVRIEQGLKNTGRPLLKFLAAADVRPNTWYALRRGEWQPKAFTLRKLLCALADETPVAKPPSVLAAYHRQTMALFADAMKLDRDTVLATDFSVQRPADAAWRKASEARMFAVYVVAVELQVDNPDIARAIGVSRQAVKKARDRVEDLREKPDVDALIAQVTRLATGRV